MKLLKLALLFLLIMSCRNNSLKINSKVPISNFTDDSTLIGTWSICAEECNDTLYQFNTCSSLYFKSDGTGGYAKNSPFVEKFNWTYKKGFLKFHNDPENLSTTFADTAYYLVLNKRDSYIDLRISKIGEDFSYLSTR